LSGPGASTRRRLLVAGIAALAVLGIATAAAWPHRPGAVARSAAGEGYTPPVLDPTLGGTASPAASGSRPAASAKASPSATRASGSPGAPTGSAGAAAAAPPGAPSQTPVNLDGNTNLAAGRSTRDSSHSDVYSSVNITDGNAMTYWESRANIFPQWVQVDLGAPADLRRAVLRLPPSAAWPARTQRIEIQVSNDNQTFTSLIGAATYTFDNATAQTTTITLPGSSWRYVRLVFTANSVQAAGQLSSLELYRA
jgi:hypothetical protein